MTAAGESPASVSDSKTKVADERPSTKPVRRDDLDGVRAFAILLVVVYHVWIGRVSGGVDVFLMLSAYFLTGSLVRRAEKGSFRLGRYYVHRFWRLVPPAAVTIVGTLALVWWLFPTSAWPNAWLQSIASLLYVQNWELALNSVDYYARGSADVSPFLHFWSLSIQGQVFVVWPLLLLLCVGVTKLVQARLRTVIAVVFGVVFAASLVYSIISTAHDQQFAYFDTGARLWEFALGTLLALLPDRVRLPRILGQIVALVALAGLLTCGIVLDVSGGFPGYLALWPTLCAAALVITGRRATLVGSFLGSRLIRSVGRIAYPLYLVHWPLLVTWSVWTGEAHPGIVDGALIIGVSVVLAIIIHVIIEKPAEKVRLVERRPWVGGAALVAICAVIVAGVMGWRSYEQARALEIVAGSSNPGAAAVDSLFPIDSGQEPMIPLGSTLDHEWVQLDGPCTGINQPAGELAAQNCIERYTNDGGQRMVVIGDSHAEQWIGAIEPNVVGRNVKLSGIVYSACTYTMYPEEPATMPGCDQLRTEVTEYLEAAPPEYVVLVGTQAVADSPDEVLREGLAETVDTLTSWGIEVILVRDNPRFSEDQYACAEEYGADPLACGGRLADLLAEDDPLNRFVEEDGVHVVDLTPYFCPDDYCPAVIGNVAVYIDNNHITWAYMRTLAPMLAEALETSGLDWD